MACVVFGGGAAFLPPILGAALACRPSGVGDPGRSARRATGAGAGAGRGPPRLQGAIKATRRQDGPRHRHATPRRQDGLGRRHATARDDTTEPSREPSQSPTPRERGEAAGGKGHRPTPPPDQEVRPRHGTPDPTTHNYPHPPPPAPVGMFFAFVCWCLGSAFGLSCSRFLSPFPVSLPLFRLSSPITPTLFIHPHRFHPFPSLIPDMSRGFGLLAVSVVVNTACKLRE